MFLLLTLAACGKLDPLSMDFTIANQSGYDFLYFSVATCYDAQGIDCDLYEAESLATGTSVTVNGYVGEGEYGITELWVSALAIDVDADGYCWEDCLLVPVPNAPVMDVNVTFTLDDCCVDF